MTEEDKAIYSVKKSLTNVDLKKWCETNSLTYHEIDLENLQDSPDRYCYVFTGATKNDVNHGNTHHWLFLDGNLVFDSYGNKKSWTLPEGFQLIQNNPHQLQAFNSTVKSIFIFKNVQILNSF